MHMLVALTARDIFRKLLHVAFVLIPLLLVTILSTNGYARQPITLVIWMEDKGGGHSNVKVHQALSRKKYDKALKIWNEMGLEEIKSVFIEYGHAKELLEEIEKVLSHDDLIANLIIVTHGVTDRQRNVTMLESLGDFGGEGSTSLLHSLFEYLGPYFGENLHISLQACSTACGSKDQFEARVDGLRKELLKFEVRRFSLWGGRQAIAYDDNFEHFSTERAKRAHKDWIVNLMKTSLKFGMAGGAVGSYFLTSGWSSGSYQAISSALTLGAIYSGVGFATLFGTVYPLVKIFGSSSYTRGYLIFMDGAHTEVLNVNVGTFESLQGQQSRCRMALSAPN